MMAFLLLVRSYVLLSAVAQRTSAVSKSKK